MPLPAISLVAVPGRRRLTLEIARDIERRGYAGIYTPSMYGNMSQCEAMCWNTDRIPFGTAIAPIYARTVLDFAQSAAFMHEVSGGRFRLGIGVAATSSKSFARSRVSASSRPSSLRRSGRRWWRSRARSPRAWCSPTHPARI
jgi:alkanesulfonate monooxygenase SsuD/methylene tetrahydromethanopterin reductase-like flavin-dependent oxidoreductase (luciferase family)